MNFYLRKSLDGRTKGTSVSGQEEGHSRNKRKLKREHSLLRLIKIRKMSTPRHNNKDVTNPKANLQEGRRLRLLEGLLPGSWEKTDFSRRHDPYFKVRFKSAKRLIGYILAQLI